MIVTHWFERGGNRLVVVLKQGPKWVRLLDCGDLHPHKVSTKDFDKHSRQVDVRPRKLAASLDRTRKLYKRLGMFGSRFTEKPVREAIKLLRQKEVKQQ